MPNIINCSNYNRVLGDIPLTLNNLIREITKAHEINKVNDANNAILFSLLDAFGIDNSGESLLLRSCEQIKYCLDIILKETKEFNELIILSFKKPDNKNGVFVCYKGEEKFCNLDNVNVIYNCDFYNDKIAICDIKSNDLHYQITAPLVFLYGDVSPFLKFSNCSKEKNYIERYTSILEDTINAKVIHYNSENASINTRAYLHRKSIFNLALPKSCDFEKINKIDNANNPNTEQVIYKGALDSNLVLMENSKNPKRLTNLFLDASKALVKRIEAVGAKGVVFGLSGGIDSTSTLLMCLDARKQKDFEILTVSMPGFGTSKGTRNNAKNLAESFGVKFKEIDITKSVLLHFRNIEHDKDNKNIVFENAQARERAQILMDLANKYGYIQLGTSDLSEAVLGWCTYAGDQSAMFNTNLSFSKTQLRSVISDKIKSMDAKNDKKKINVLTRVLETPISPELLPVNEKGEISQKTEDINGPYEVIDDIIYLYFYCGYERDEIIQILFNDLCDKGKYEKNDIAKWCDNFFNRMLHSQFKRKTSASYPVVTKIGYVLSLFDISEELI